MALLSSGLAVARFTNEIQKELRNRSQLAREALAKGLNLQEVHLGQGIAKGVKHGVGQVWNKEIDDLSGWYQERVASANEEIAKQRPFEPEQCTVLSVISR